MKGLAQIRTAIGLSRNEINELTFFKDVSNPRNASLMRIISGLEYVEQTGHGIPEVISHYGKGLLSSFRLIKSPWKAALRVYCTLILGTHQIVMEI